VCRVLFIEYKSSFFYSYIAIEINCAYNISIGNPLQYVIVAGFGCTKILQWNGECNVATKSFIKEFAISRKNADKVVKALNVSRPITLCSNVRVEDVKKDQIKNFLKMDD